MLVLNIASVGWLNHWHSKVIYVGRPSPWGNPYEIGPDGNRETVVAKYEAWIAERPELVEQLALLEPDALLCHCAPELCHADVLVRAIMVSR